jgi:hypothetical protein
LDEKDPSVKWLRIRPRVSSLGHTFYRTTGDLMLDDWSRGASSRTATGMPALWLGATALLAVTGLAIAFLGNARLSLLAYVIVLVLGTACLAMFRWAEATRSLRPDYVIPARWKRRASIVPTVLLLVCCTGNAFVWATEVAKI